MMMKQKMNRLISAVLCILLLPVVSFGSGIAGQQTGDPFAIGTAHHGFHVYQTESVGYLGLDLYFLEHEKTGAQLIYAACDDQERAFGVAFRTQAQNDKGLPHVFEHSALAGSEKYPDPNLIFNMLNQTYNTYINAETRNYVTLYPIASLSEEQLFVDMDVYMSGVLHPALLKEERAMMREAWHYNLDDPEDDITVSGIVYSEMAANYNVMQYVATYRLAKMLFPGSYCANDAGGDPAVIPDMIYQELLDFHAKYYHPSNMLLMLYGDFADIERFLAHLDSEYLSGYERTEICIDDPDYRPAEGYQELCCSFPAAQNAETDHQSMITYAFVLDDPSQTDYLLADFASIWLTMESCPMKQRMSALFPASSFDITFQNNTVQPTIQFNLINAESADAPLFKETVDQMIPMISETAIDENLIDLIIHSEKYQQATTRENQHVGVSVFNAFADSWARAGRPDAYMDELRFYDDLEKYKADGSFHTVLGKLLRNATSSAMLVMIPEPGLDEKNAAEQAKKLADLKAAMSDEEIRALIDQCADFNAWIESNANISMIDMVKAVQAESLPEKYETAPVTDETVNGVRYITSEIPDSEVFKMSVYLDAQGLAFESLLDAELAISLIGQIGTAAYSKEALQSEMFSKCNSLVNSLKMVYDADGSAHQYLYVSGNGVIDQLEDTFRLVEEILLHTDFSDYDTIREVAAESAMRSDIVGSMMPEVFMDTIGKAAVDAGHYVNYYLSCSPEYKAYNERVAMMSDAEIAEVAKRLQNAVRFLLNRPGAIVTAIGNAETLARCREASDALLARLGNETYAPVDYSAHSTLKGNTAYVIDTSVAYNYIFFNMQAANEKLTGRHLVARSLVTDMILLPELRFRNNAYGASNIMGTDFSYMSSYRDPNIDQTYTVFETIPERLRSLTLTEEELDGYITAAYASVVYPRGPLTKAEEAVNDTLRHLDPARYLRNIREIKGTTIEDIHAAADLYERIVKEGTRASALNEEMLAGNPGFFETIVRPSGK